MADTSVDDIFAAIKTYWDANKGVGQQLAGIVGPMREEMAPTPAMGINSPYVAFSSLTNERTNTSTHSEYWLLVFRFEIRNGTSEKNRPIFLKVTNVFDRPPITLPSGKGQILLWQRRTEQYGKEDKVMAYSFATYEVRYGKPSTQRLS